MSESAQIVHHAVVCIVLHNQFDSLVTKLISSQLPRRSVSGDQLFMKYVTTFLNFFQAIYKFPKRWMVHLEFGLDALQLEVAVTIASSWVCAELSRGRVGGVELAAPNWRRRIGGAELS